MGKNTNQFRNFVKARWPEMAIVIFVLLIFFATLGQINKTNEILISNTKQIHKYYEDNFNCEPKTGIGIVTNLSSLFEGLNFSRDDIVS